LFYFNKDLVLQAIDDISNVEFKSTPYKNEKDLLSYFLLLSRMGINKYNAKTIKDVFIDEELFFTTLYELSGVFDVNENIKKKGSLFFTTFFHKKVESTNYTFEDKSFYNPGTEFYRLKGRMADTIDNSVSNYILDPKIIDTKTYYTFKKNVEDIIVSQYNKKFSLASVLIWIYRNRAFDREVRFFELKDLFADEYNISPEQINKLFKIEQAIFTFDHSPILAFDIRDYLNINDNVQIDSKEVDSIINTIPVTQDRIRNITGATMNKEMLVRLIKKYQQVIITGVPGTGKSYMIEELSEEFEIKKVQFHQNYTYQEFILGKTIKDGNVEYEKGIFLDFVINEVIPNENTDYLFVIDEINRGNTSAIFGELLHALDRNKPIELANGDILDLPKNLFIVGSMNSADRSIALVDYAIRRRFIFIELEPDYNLLDTISTFNDNSILGSFLQKINTSIERVLNNRDFRLGHSYFIGDKSNYDSTDIYEIIQYKIIPILYEYVQGDSERIREILTNEIVNAQPDELEDAIIGYLENDKN
jgi:5-methylcytosine-specific restriction protein B